MRSLPGTDHSDPDGVVATKIQQDVVQLLTVTSNLNARGKQAGFFRTLMVVDGIFADGTRWH